MLNESKLWKTDSKSKSVNEPKSSATHPFRSEKYQKEIFPQSAQFLDFQWTPEGLSGQFRGVMSGLKPLYWDCLIHVDTRQFNKGTSINKESSCNFFLKNWYM